MNPLLLARAGLMGLGRLPGFLGRGTGWRKGAKGVKKLIEPEHTLRYTPIRPLAKPSVHPYMKGVAPSRLRSPWIRRFERAPQDEIMLTGRGGKDYLLSDVGGRVGRAGKFGRGGATATYPRRATQLPAGYIRRKPYWASAWGLGGLGLGALGTYPFIAGDEEPPIDPSLLMTTPEPWTAPEGVLDFAEAEAARAERGEKNIQDMLTKGFLIAAAGGDPSKFFDRGLEVLKASEQYKVDKDYAKVVRAVYKKGDMPKNARDAYDRLAPLVGPEKAAILSGHQLGMEEGKTKEERLWKKIFDMAQYDPESAAAELVAAWGTKRLGNAPVSSDWNIRMEKAREIIQGVVSGGVGYPEGVQNIRAASA
jgi:hypothetical protein